MTTAAGQPPNLLMATHYFGSHRGGIELVAERLAIELLAEGQPVAWLACDASPAPVLPPGGRTVTVRAWNFVERRTGLPFPIPVPFELRRVAREVGSADVVLLHDCLYLTNLLVFLLAKLKGRPVAIVQHIGFVPYANPLLRVLMRLANALVSRPMLARADQVVFISELTGAHFAGVRFRRPPRTIFNGVDSTIFRPPSKLEKAHARQALGLPPDGTVIAFVGRFVEKKGLHILRTIAAQRPQLTFAAAGRGPLDPAQWALGNVAVYRELAGANLAELYRAADLLLLPSTGEGFPLVVQEALACGLAVLCGDETARADSAAKAHVHGAAIVAGNDAATAGNFLAVLDQLLRKGAGDGAERAAFAAARYRWTAVAQAYRSLLREMSGPRAGTPCSRVD